MNIMLAVTIIGLGILCGMFFSIQLREREKTMSFVLLLIKEITVQIRYTNSEIGDILRSAAQSTELKRLYFLEGCREIEPNTDFHEIWNSGVKKQPYLNTRDRELLIGLGDRLGQTDTEGQLSFLEMYAEMIKNRLEEAKRDYKDKGKLYRSLGLLCGLAVGIMVL